MLYLDNAATTKVNEKVMQEMLEARYAYGNSEAKFYAPAEDAKKLISLARQRVANIVNASPEEVIFTSGATEANNLVLKGSYWKNFRQKNKIVISSIEHSSIYDTCKFLESIGAELAIVSVDKTGMLNLTELEACLDEKTALVSIIYVNNEVGTIQNLDAIDEICKKHKVKLHIDATQAVGKVNIDISKYSSLNYITFTAHKIYGPKGVGCLIKRNIEDNDIIPLLHGGEQENGLRAGTLANELIVGFGKACEIAQLDFNDNHRKLIEYENIVLKKLLNKFGKRMVINNDFSNRIAGLLNIRLSGYSNMVLLKSISSDVAASTGSACAVSKPSRVLQNMGFDETTINESIRISISPYEEISNFDYLDKL